MEIVHLHVQSNYSISSGFASPTELVDRAATLGMRALALTDLHTIAGVPEFWKRCLEKNIQPIIGSELNVWFDDEEQIDDGHHRMILLVESEEGYVNLVHLLNIANNRDGREAKGICYSDLHGHTNGLVALVGGERSWFRFLLKTNPLIKVVPYIDFLLMPENNLFDVDKLVVALEPSGDSSDAGIILNQYNMAQSKRLLCVAISDVRCLKVEETVCCDFLDGKTAPEEFDMSTIRRNLCGKHMLTGIEMAGRLNSEAHIAINNSLFVMGRCSMFNPEILQFSSPAQDFVRGMSAETYICDKTLKDATAKLGLRELTNEIRERLDEELNNIMSLKWANNMLLLHEIARFGRDNGYVMGVGRGKILSSLVAYILGVTQINPIQHHFKFLGFNSSDAETGTGLYCLQVEVPRHFSIRLSEYLSRRLGEEHAIIVGCYQKVSKYNVLQRVLTWLGIDSTKLEHYWDQLDNDQVSELQTDTIGVSSDVWKRDNPHFVNFLISRLQNCYKGIIPEDGHFAVSGDNLMRLVPLTQYCGIRVAQFDALGLDTFRIPRLEIDDNPMLDLLDMAVRCVRYQDNPKFETDALPLDDDETYLTLSKGDTLGIEMLRKLTLRSMLRENTPRDFQSFLRLLSSREATDAGVIGDIWHRTPDALIAYRLAFVKTHYPKAFYAALLSHKYKDKPQFSLVLREIEGRNISLIKPDINESRYYFHVAADGIKIGMMLVDGLTLQAYEAIDHVRKSGEFTGVLDFCSRVPWDEDNSGVTMELVNDLIDAGIMDCFDYTRSEMRWMVENYAERAKSGDLSECSTATGRFKFGITQKEVHVPEISKESNNEELQKERRILGWNFGQTVFSRWNSMLRQCKCSGASVISTRMIGKKVCVAGLICNDSSDMNHPIRMNDDDLFVWDLEGKTVVCGRETSDYLKNTANLSEPVIAYGIVSRYTREAFLTAEVIYPVAVLDSLLHLSAKVTIDLSKMTLRKSREFARNLRLFKKGNCELKIRDGGVLKSILFPSSISLTPEAVRIMKREIPDIEIQVVSSEIYNLDTFNQLFGCFVENGISLVSS